MKSSTKPTSISSRPVQVILCNHSQYGYGSTKKGHTFTISVKAVDQVRNPMNATIRSFVISESGVARLKEGQAKQEVGNQCTELEYNVFSQDSSAQVELYAEGPCNNLGISRQLVNISFLPCIYALVDSNQSMASPILSASVTAGADPTGSRGCSSTPLTLDKLIIFVIG